MNKYKNHVSKVPNNNGNIKVKRTKKPGKFELKSIVYLWFIQAQSRDSIFRTLVTMTKVIDMNKMTMSSKQT